MEAEFDPNSGQHTKPPIKLQKAISKALEAISPFKITAYYQPDTKFMCSQAEFVYEHFYSKQRDFKKKIHEKFLCNYMCPNNHNWQVPLMVLDINYCFIACPNNKTRTSVQQKEAQASAIQQHMVFCLLQLVSNNVKPHLENALYDITDYDLLQKQVCKLAVEHTLQVVFKYKLYRQKCILCHKYGDVQLDRNTTKYLAKKFKIFLEKLLHGWRQVHRPTRGEHQNNVKEIHKQDKCEACQLGECPISGVSYENLSNAWYYYGQDICMNASMLLEYFMILKDSTGTGQSLRSTIYNCGISEETWNTIDPAIKTIFWNLVDRLEKEQNEKAIQGIIKQQLPPNSSTPK